MTACFECLGRGWVRNEDSPDLTQAEPFETWTDLCPRCQGTRIEHV